MKNTTTTSASTQHDLPVTLQQSATPPAIPSPGPIRIERSMVRSAVRSGTRDEDSLTDLVFFQRHPERNGRAISQNEPDFRRLSQEWLNIRDTLVRPILLRSIPAPSQATPATSQPTPALSQAPPAAFQPNPGVGEPDIVSVHGVFKVARQIAPQIEALLAAAEADGIELGCASSYRPIEEQIRLRKQNCGPTDYDIWQKHPDQCTRPTAIPGTSNHEKGLAIDFTYNGKSMTRDDPGFRWLAANAARFGLRNLPSEAWHWSVNGH